MIRKCDGGDDDDGPAGFNIIDAAEKSLTGDQEALEKTEVQETLLTLTPPPSVYNHHRTYVPIYVYT